MISYRSIVQKASLGGMVLSLPIVLCFGIAGRRATQSAVDQYVSPAVHSPEAGEEGRQAELLRLKGMLEHFTKLNKEFERGKRFQLVADIGLIVFAASLTLLSLATWLRKMNRQSNANGTEPAHAIGRGQPVNDREDGER